METSGRKDGALPPTISLSFDSWSKNSHSRRLGSFDIAESNTAYGDESLFSINEANLKGEEDEKAYARTIFQHTIICKKAAAELLSTFVVVFAGCGAIMIDTRHKVLTHVGVSTVFGSAVMAMLYAVGHISGGHMNPAVSIAFSTLGQLPWRETPLYIAAQIAGATLAAAALKYVLANVSSVTVAATVPEHAFQSLAVEFVLTFIVMFVLSAMASDPRAVGNFTGVAVGGTIAMNGLFAGPVSGASMNPARSLGPALLSGIYDGLWVYVFGPILGALCGAWAYRAIQLHH